MLQKKLGATARFFHPYYFVNTALILLYLPVRWYFGDSDALRGEYLSLGPTNVRHFFLFSFFVYFSFLWPPLPCFSSDGMRSGRSLIIPNRPVPTQEGSIIATLFLTLILRFLRCNTIDAFVATVFRFGQSTVGVLLYFLDWRLLVWYIVLVIGAFLSGCVASSSHRSFCLTWRPPSHFFFDDAGGGGSVRCLAAAVAWVIFPQPDYDGPQRITYLDEDGLQALVERPPAASADTVWLVEAFTTWNGDCREVRSAMSETRRLAQLPHSPQPSSHRCSHICPSSTHHRGFDSARSISDATVTPRIVCVSAPR